MKREKPRQGKELAALLVIEISDMAKTGSARGKAARPGMPDQAASPSKKLSGRCSRIQRAHWAGFFPWAGQRKVA